MSNNKLQIAIVGGGIAGFSLFQALKFMDNENKLEIKIYESVNTVSAIGAGIYLSPRAQHILEDIGVGEQIAKILPDDDPNALNTHVLSRKSDQLKGFPVQESKMRARRGYFLRSELLEVLSIGITNELHLGHRLLSYEEHDAGLVLHFDNGLVASCDFLVGADGIRSAVRRSFLEKQGLCHSPSMNPIWTGAFIYRGLIPADCLQAEFPGHPACETLTSYLGKYKNLTGYRVSRAGPVNIAAIVSNPSKEGTNFEGPIAVPCSQDEVLSAFEGWEPEALALVKCLENPVRWTLDTLQPLSSFAKGRVALIGDSAHAMTPYQSSGGGSAVEDSYILASLLSSPNCTKTSIPKISEVYDAVRVGPANEVAELSRIVGTLFHLRGPGFENVVEGDTSVTADQMKTIFETIRKMWGALHLESVQQNRERALIMLQERSSKD